MRLIDADDVRKNIQIALDTLGEPTKEGLKLAMSIIDRTPTGEWVRNGYAKTELDYGIETTLRGEER